MGWFEYSDMSKDDIAWISLMGGYFMMFFLVIPFLFFDNDQGCDWIASIWGQCHRSRRAEQIYVGTALLFSVAGAVVWLVMIDEDRTNNMLAMCSLLALIRLIILATVLDLFVTPKPHTPFYAGSNSRVQVICTF